MKETIILFVYSILKAFLPLPSLEVVLLPLNMQRPDLLWWYSFIGAIGTFIGGSIGYLVANFVKEETWSNFFGENAWERGKRLVNKYGVFAVFIGGITPIPDFLLAYIAGFVRMNYIAFAISDGLARFLRSVLILMSFNQLGILIDMDKYGMFILYAMLFYMVTKYLLKVMKSRVG